MAYTTTMNDVWNQPSRLYPEFDVNTIDYTIGGKMLSTRLVVKDIEQMHFQSNEEYKAAIKNKLAHNIAQFMVEKGLIEFTHLPQPYEGSTIIHARCYVVPDEQVKILRTKAPNGI